jgi:hypothetical protein
MGAARWALRQIINLCGRIPAPVLKEAKRADNLSDPERNGINSHTRSDSGPFELLQLATCFPARIPMP